LEAGIVNRQRSNCSMAKLAKQSKSSGLVRSLCFDLFQRLRPDTVLTTGSSVNNTSPRAQAGHSRDNISTHSVLNVASIAPHSLESFVDL
jgi:hypothetical protein